jgi:hypothetical protein
MNPIIKTLIALLTWVILTVLCVVIIGDIPKYTETPLAIIMLSFYLAPFVCIIVFAISLFFNQVWLKKHIIGSIVFTTLLISWVIYIFVYLHSLIG